MRQRPANGKPLESIPRATVTGSPIVLLQIPAAGVSLSAGFSSLEGSGCVEFMIPGFEVETASFPTDRVATPGTGVDVAGGSAVWVRASDTSVATCWGTSVPGTSVRSGDRAYCVPGAQEDKIMATVITSREIILARNIFSLSEVHLIEWFTIIIIL